MSAYTTTHGVYITNQKQTKHTPMQDNDHQPVFAFLAEASAPAFLGTIRAEVKPRARSGKAEVDDEVLADAAALSDDDDDDTTTSAGYKRFSGKLVRQQSPSLLRLIHTHFPKLQECNSDTSCFLAVVAHSIASFHFKADPKDAKLRLVLEQIASIVRAMHPHTSTQRNYFVELTSLFKSYWVSRGETDKTGKHVELVRSILHADRSDVAEYLHEKEQKLVSKLRDRFHVLYDDVQHKTLQAYDRVMNPGVEHVDNEMLAGLLVALETSFGMRKGAILDPHVKFYTYSEWKRVRARQGMPVSSFRIGTIADSGFGDSDDEYSMDMNQDAFEDEIGMEHVCVQVGVLKDAEVSINKYIDEDDERWGRDRILVKPSIILTAKQLVRGIQTFRRLADITTSTFVSRKHSSNAWGSARVGPVIRHMYPSCAALSAKHGWPLGSHLARRIYANASFAIYEERVRNVTGKYVDKSVWISNMLGHQGSVKTSLSYATVVVDFKMADAVFATPPEQQIRLLQGQIKLLQDQFAELKRERRTEASVDALVAEDTVNLAEVSFRKEDGTIVTLPKHRRRNFKSKDDRDSAVEMVYDRLSEHSIAPTNANLAKAGLGRKTITDYKRDHNLAEPAAQRRPIEPVAEPERRGRSPAVEAQAQPKKKMVELPDGVKVIAQQAKPSQKLKGEALRKRNQQYLERDRQKFGADNVLETEDECDGEIEKRRKLGPNLSRDVCVDKSDT